MIKTRIITMFFSLIALLLLAAGPASAAEDMMDNLLPDQSNKKQEGKVELEYNKYPLSRYGMDTHLEEGKMTDFMPWGWDEGVGKQINQGMGMLNSTLWGFNKIIAATVGTLVQESYSFDIIGNFADDISQAVQNIAGFGPGGFKTNGLWPYLISSIFVIAAVWAAYIGVIKRSTSQAIGGIISSIVIMTLAFGFFTNSDKILTGINSGTSEVQNDVLSFSVSATSSDSFDESEGIASMRNQIFNLMIKYPYLLLEFGTTDEDKIESEWKKSGSRTDAVLKTGIFSKERQEAIKYEVEDMKNANMKPEALTDRFVILILLLVMNCIMGGTLLLISGSMIFFQILALVFTLFTPVAFLIGLIPAFSHTARNLFMKLLHTFYMKVTLGLLTTVLFTISSMVYNTMNPKEGYVLLFLIQIICYVAVWIKRHEIMNVVTVPFRNFNVNNNAGSTIKEYKQSYFKTKKHLKQAVRPLTAPAAPLVERYNKIKFNPGIGVVNPINHPQYAPRDRKPAATPAENRNSTPVKPFARQEQKQTEPEPRTKTVPKNPEPQTAADRERDFENLQETQNKGRWGHRAKEEVNIKPELQDRMKERKRAAAADQDLKIKDWRDKR